MAGKDIFRMSKRELQKGTVVQAVIAGRMKQKEAATVLALSTKQVGRLVKVVRIEGIQGIAHKSRGRPSNRKLPDELKERVKKLYEDKYRGFGPTFFAEKLSEDESLIISSETLRQWLISWDCRGKQRKRSCHRKWRPRKECFGEMVQMDGSHHDWLEGRGPKLVLMGYIDDATSNVYARFYAYEGTIPALDSFMRYVEKYGLPQSVYLDRHTTYKSTAKPTIEDELEDRTPMSQFQRAMHELGVQMIYALSPQGKGRVERLFETLQDRLVKEMRLRGINTCEEANLFLEEYLPKYNNKFRVCPANATDVHSKIPTDMDLNNYLCIKTERIVTNDNTIMKDNTLYQLNETVASKKVIVEDLIDGTMNIKVKGCHKKLKYKEIKERPVREVRSKEPRARKTYKPAPNHPWRKYGRIKANPTVTAETSP